MASTKMVLPHRQSALPSLAALPSQSDWSTMLSMAAELVKSGLLPKTVATPQAALVLILKGRELGVPPLYALANIVLINGKPTCQAELMLGLLYRDHGDDALQVEESTAQVCVVSYKRRGWPARREYRFSIEDAKTANLLGKDTWKQYPTAMLRARCISAVARMAFPDSIGGMYLPEEMGAAVDVQGDEVVIKDVTPPTGRAKDANGHANTTYETIEQEAEQVVSEPAEVAERRRFMARLEKHPKIAAWIESKGYDLQTCDIGWIRQQSAKLDEKETDAAITPQEAPQADTTPSAQEPPAAATASELAIPERTLSAALVEQWERNITWAREWLEPLAKRKPNSGELITGGAVLAAQAALLGAEAVEPATDSAADTVAAVRSNVGVMSQRLIEQMPDDEPAVDDSERIDAEIPF